MQICFIVVRSQINLAGKHHYSWRDKIPEMALKTPRSVYSIDHIKYKFWLYYNFICDLIKQGTNSKRKDILGIFIVLHLTVSVV